MTHTLLKSIARVNGMGTNERVKIGSENGNGKHGWEEWVNGDEGAGS